MGVADTSKKICTYCKSEVAVVEGEIPRMYNCNICKRPVWVFGKAFRVPKKRSKVWKDIDKIVEAHKKYLLTAKVQTPYIAGFRGCSCCSLFKHKHVGTSKAIRERAIRKDIVDRYYG